MKLTDQPKDLVKAVQEVIKSSTPAANEKAKDVSSKLSSRYESMRPKKINESLRPEVEKKFAENPKGVEVHMKHEKTGKVEVTKFPGTFTAVKAAKRHIADMEKQGYKLHAKKLMEDDNQEQDQKETTMDKKLLVVEKMMKKLQGKLDPVGKEDADVNNDGKTDKTDSYLKNRREAIATAMRKEEVEQKEPTHAVTLTRGSVVGARSHKMFDVVADDEDHAVKVAKKQFKEKFPDEKHSQYHVSHVHAYKNYQNESVEQVDEASYSAKQARAGEDIGKPGKMFSKIAASAAKRYGSEEAGKRVAGAILKKLRGKGK